MGYGRSTVLPGMESHHDHSDESTDEPSRFGALLHRLGHLVSHDHDHGGGHGESVIDSGAIGIRATKVSLIALGLTAALQAIIVIFSGSVALLSDTLHNLADALTAIPLWIAFAVGRRRPTRGYTYGFGRFEDVAGLLIVVAIGASAALIIWESVGRLVEPRLIDHIPWVIAAGLVGAAGNEFVARYRIKVGKEIGSEALVSDGQHARSDALTSLAVVVAGIGAGFGAAWVDPVAGIVVAGAMLWLLGRTARRMSRRLLDGVEPGIVDDVEGTVRGVDGVRDIADLRVRWHGHQLSVAVSICVDTDLSVSEGHDAAHEVEHALHHRFTFPVQAIVHVEPFGRTEAHDATAHHNPA
jgi:cation diffusion facilitator family transporter